MFAFEGDVRNGRARSEGEKMKLLNANIAHSIECSFLCVSCMEIYRRLKQNIETLYFVFRYSPHPLPCFSVGIIAFPG